MAKILFEKFLNGTCNKKELDLLMEILRQNDHEATFRSMLEKVYQDIDSTYEMTTEDQKQQTAGVDPAMDDEQAGASDTVSDVDVQSAGPQSFEAPGKLRRLRYLAGIAASLLLVIGAGYFWQIRKDTQAQRLSGMGKLAIHHEQIPFKEGTYKNQQTSRAEQKYMLLPDGTQVWLNAESSLIIPDRFDSKKRVVYLKGEAFFDVKHADKVPFIIHMPNNITTTVLGTAFDIKAYGDKAFCVSVKRGKVQVSKDKKTLATLSIGQQIKMADNYHIQPVVQQVKQENIASWTEGKLSYDASELLDVLNDLERVYNVQIELKNKKLSAEVITTSFNREDGIGKILKTLCMLTGTQLQPSGQGYVIE